MQNGKESFEKLQAVWHLQGKLNSVDAFRNHAYLQNLHVVIHFIQCMVRIWP